VLARERREHGAGHDEQGADRDERAAGPPPVLAEDQHIIRIVGVVPDQDVIFRCPQVALHEVSPDRPFGGRVRPA
jgi:hypothetical protein